MNKREAEVSARMSGVNGVQWQTVSHLNLERMRVVNPLVPIPRLAIGEIPAESGNIYEWRLDQKTNPPDLDFEQIEILANFSDYATDCPGLSFEEIAKLLGVDFNKARDAMIRLIRVTKYMEKLFNMIVFPNENSEAHNIWERQTAKAPALASHSVLQGRRNFRSRLHRS